MWALCSLSFLEDFINVLPAVKLSVCLCFLCIWGLHMFVCMDGCAQVCVCVSVCVRMRALAHVNVEATIRGLSLFSTLFSGTGLSLNLEFFNSPCQ